MTFLWRSIDELVGKGLENSVIIELMSYAAIGLVPLAIPLAVLLASIMAFGNLGERFELIAIKSSGISLLKIMRPLIILVSIITVAAFFLANELVPVANSKFYALLKSIERQRPEMIIKEGVFSNDIDNYSIKVGERDPNTNALLDIMIYDHTDRRVNTNVILADSGYFNMSNDKQNLILTLFKGERYYEGDESKVWQKRTFPFRRETFSKETIVISLKNFNLNRLDENYFKNSYHFQNNKQIKAEVQQIGFKYGKKEQDIAQSLHYNVLLDNEIKKHYYPDSIQIDSIFATVLPINVDSTFNYLENNQKISVLKAAQIIAQQNQRNILKSESEFNFLLVSINKNWIEWNRRYILALACLLFFFIGAPLGAIIRKGGFGMPVIISILLFISYYLSMSIGNKIAREGTWSVAMVVWIPTYIYLILGVFITHQAVTDASILKSNWHINLVSNLLKHIRPKHNK